MHSKIYLFSALKNVLQEINYKSIEKASRECYPYANFGVHYKKKMECEKYFLFYCNFFGKNEHGPYIRSNFFT